MSSDRERDLIIVGGGIGGVISLKYAKDAGLDAILLESRDSVGGLWRDLPAWQDIQFRDDLLFSESALSPSRFRT